MKTLEEEINQYVRDETNIIKDACYFGYNLAQKEMQEKLDAAIEVIKYADEYLKYEGIENEKFIKMSRDFLKARGEQ